MNILKTAISIGNFDAVHKGHQALVQAARDSVGFDGRVEMLSFDPLPVTVLRPDIHVDRITTFEQREALLLDAGADEVHRIVSTKELLEMQPDEFLQEIVQKYAPVSIVEGAGFRFGKDRMGNIDTLKSCGNDLGFSCIEVDGLEVELHDSTNVRASSSIVRTLLQEGRVLDVQRILGRAYSLTGEVIQGDHRGRKIGFPTANLGKVQTMLPKDGIYAGTVEVDSKLFIAAISIGTKPTFGEHNRVCEVHIIGFDGEIGNYNWQLRVTISHWIREQLVFDSVEALTIAIQRDIQKAITLIESNL